MHTLIGFFVFHNDDFYEPGWWNRKKNGPHRLKSCRPASKCVYVVYRSFRRCTQKTWRARCIIVASTGTTRKPKMYRTEDSRTLALSGVGGGQQVITTGLYFCSFFQLFSRTIDTSRKRLVFTYTFESAGFVVKCQVTYEGGLFRRRTNRFYPRSCSISWVVY